MPNSNTTSLVQRVSEEGQVSERDEQTKKFEALISKKRYMEIAEFGKKMNNEELLKCLCQVVTSLAHFKGLYEYLKRRNLVPDFLANGKMTVAKGVIAETNLLETDDFGGCVSIYNAIALSLNDDRHGRAAGLFEAAQERPAWKHKFNWFVHGFFVSYPPEKDSMPLKQFLSFYGEEPGKKHPVILKLFMKY